MKVCIIKLGALGDVVRTTPLLSAIKQKYPDSEITWITRQNAKEILEGNSNIKQILTLPITQELEFDILYNIDIEPEATQLASKIKAEKKYGYYDNEGFPTSFNPGAEYYLNTVFDDELKKVNRKTYQEMIFEAAELEYNKQPCEINLSEEDKEYANTFIEENNIKTDNLIGIHMGSSPRWPSKTWDADKLKEFITNAKDSEYEIILFGGPNELDKLEPLISELKQQNIEVYQNNPENSIKQFTSLVNICDKIVCGDTFALHIALALKKQTTGLFFCSTPHEIEGYNFLTKITSPMFKQFFPEKMDQYDKELINSISVEQVFETINNKNPPSS